MSLTAQTTLTEDVDNFSVVKEKITHGTAPWSNKNTVHWLTMKPRIDKAAKEEEA